MAQLHILPRPTEQRELENVAETALLSTLPVSSSTARYPIYILFALQKHLQMPIKTQTQLYQAEIVWQLQ